MTFLKVVLLITLPIESRKLQSVCVVNLWTLMKFTWCQKIIYTSLAQVAWPSATQWAIITITAKIWNCRKHSSIHIKWYTNCKWKCVHGLVVLLHKKMLSVSCVQYLLVLPLACTHTVRVFFCIRYFMHFVQNKHLVQGKAIALNLWVKMMFLIASKRLMQCV